MKNFLTAVLCIGLLAACGGGDKKNKAPSSQTDITQNPDYQKGLTLVAKNKCLQCHAVEETITGPPYRQIGKKYANMPDTIITHLAKKVISGGNGVWGQIFMTPHSALSMEDAEAMVKYVLLLGKEWDC